MAGESKTARQATAAGQLGKAGKKAEVDPVLVAVTTTLKRKYADFGLYNIRSSPAKAARFLLEGLVTSADLVQDFQVGVLTNLLQTRRPFALDELVPLVKEAAAVTMEVLDAETLAARLSKTVDYVRRHAAELSGTKVEGKWQFEVITTTTQDTTQESAA